MADSSAVENPIILNLSSTYGPLLLGSLLCCLLYGMAVIQMMMYFNKYERDSIWIKLFVLLVWSIGTASTICNLVALWPPLILKWGSIHELQLTQLPLLHRVWVMGVEVFLVHMFYIYRIYMVNGRKPLLPCLLIPFALFQLIESALYTHLTLGGTSLSSLSGSTVKALGISGRAVIAFVDIAIVVLMIRALLKDGFPKFKSSKKMIVNLVILTIHTGLWTAVCAIVVFTLNASSDQLYFTIVEFPLTPLYLVSLLANLNVRNYVRGGTKPDVEYNSFPLSNSSNSALGSRRSGPGSQIAAGFQIQTKTTSGHVAAFDSESDTVNNSKPAVGF
ncbi:hypothetical protein V8D89_002420 [Ganoderma adspersum]